MAILVVCPGCRKRFQVSDQFAGRTGPCPSCKTEIKIPTKDEEVKVHAPEEFAGGGTSKKGAMVLKPVSRVDAKFSAKGAAMIGGAALAVAALALLVRRLGLIADAAAWSSLLIKAAGLLLVTPPLVIGGYAFLRDDELEPYQGRDLYLRAGAVALVYVILWGAFARVGPAILEPDALWTWLIVVPPLVVVGALAGLAALDLDFGSATLLYAFYVIVTVLLRAIAGLGWAWNIGRPT